MDRRFFTVYTSLKLLAIMNFFFLKVEAEEYEFDYCLSSLEFLPNIQHLSKILRYNMPSQANGKIHYLIIETLMLAKYIKWIYIGRPGDKAGNEIFIE